MEMTREEAIFVLKRDNPNNIAIRTGFESLYDQRKEGFSMAIKALEEESILDKVKAEIEKQEKWLLQAGYNAYNVDIAFSSIKSVLAESEDKNGNNNL